MNTVAIVLSGVSLLFSLAGFYVMAKTPLDKWQPGSAGRVSSGVLILIGLALWSAAMVLAK